MNLFAQIGCICGKTSLKIKKDTPNPSQILSYLNEILTFTCYHVHWQLGRVLDTPGHSPSNVLIEVRSKSDRVVQKGGYGDG
jgi:hypothetical protein